MRLNLGVHRLLLVLLLAMFVKKKDNLTQLCAGGCEFCYHLSRVLSCLWCWLALACNCSRLRVFLPNPCNYLPRCNYTPPPPFNGSFLRGKGGNIIKVI